MVIVYKHPVPLPFHGTTLRLQINADPGIDGEPCIGTGDDSHVGWAEFNRTLTEPEIVALDAVIAAHDPDDDTVDPARIARKAIYDLIASLEGQDIRNLDATQKLALFGAICWKAGILGLDLKIRPIDDWLIKP